MHTFIPTRPVARPEADTGADLAGLTSSSQRWWALARCNDGAATMAELFFSEEPIDIARARAICSNCAVREACLREALERAEPWGVWGGELVLNGRVQSQKRRRGRPPKHPRPELVVDELGRLLDPSVA